MSLAAAGLLVLLIIGFVGLLAFGRDLLGAQIVPNVSYTSWSISAIALATVLAVMTGLVMAGSATLT